MLVMILAIYNTSYFIKTKLIVGLQLKTNIIGCLQTYDSDEARNAGSISPQESVAETQDACVLHCL